MASVKKRKPGRPKKVILPPITTIQDLAQAIQSVVDYNWEDEKEDFRHYEGDRESHIFTNLQRLAAWLGANT